ncbi:MAG TPA: amidohydrolase family protein [Gemmatimonadaceae bacterium]|nr:amidohydrolase family protein [Gemmatimonadaceae bacterium]
MIRYHARWVLPISRPPLERATVVEHDGRIVYVGERASAPEGADVDLGDVALLPGLVNAHTHLELTVMRGFLEDLAFRTWIGRLTRARRAVLSFDALVDSSRVGIAEGLLAGITTYADTTESGAPFHAMRQVGVRGIAYQEVFGPDPAQCAESLAGLRAKVEGLRHNESDLVRVGVSPHAPYSVSDALFEATARFARTESLPIAVHVSESEDESNFVELAAGGWADAHRARGITVVTRGGSPIAMLERNHILDVRPLLIHCVRARAEDIAAIVRHDCAVAHCPASNAKLGHGIAPLAELLDSGARVGLGSDSVASNNRMDLLDEARLAILMQRAKTGRHDVVSATRALELATLGGARALGLDAEIGSLDIGKAADLTAFPLNQPRSAPVYDPVTALVFAGAGLTASFVSVAGRVMVRDGRLISDAARTASVEDHARTLAEWSRNDLVT